MHDSAKMYTTCHIPKYAPRSNLVGSVVADDVLIWGRSVRVVVHLVDEGRLRGIRHREIRRDGAAEQHREPRRHDEGAETRQRGLTQQIPLVAVID